MKTRMNVTKSEAKQIGLFGNAVLGNNSEMYIDARGGFYFNYFNGNDQTILTHENEYKDYEWRLTDINYLKQGDICKVIYKYLPKLYIYVFDKITEHYIYGDEDYEFKFCALMWGIEDNRPFKDCPFENVYKLFKKEMK
jgi:hypothetical protein